MDMVLGRGLSQVNLHQTQTPEVLFGLPFSARQQFTVWMGYIRKKNLYYHLNFYENLTFLPILLKGTMTSKRRSELGNLKL